MWPPRAGGKVAAVVAGARMAVVSEAAQPSARVPEAGQDSSGRRGRCSAFLFLADKKRRGRRAPHRRAHLSSANRPWRLTEARGLRTGELDSEIRMGEDSADDEAFTWLDPFEHDWDEMDLGLDDPH